MTSIKIIYVIVLVIPVACLLFYFVKQMIEDYKNIASNEYTPDMDSAANRLTKRRSERKKDTSSKKTRRRTKQETDAALVDEKPRNMREKRDRKSKDIKSKSQVGKKKKHTRRKFENVNTAGDELHVKYPIDYPKDPYADFKRPDLDAVIKRANERDRINKKDF